MKPSTLSIRLLVSHKKGIEKRIRTAILSAGGWVDARRGIREMRGMSELELIVSSTEPRLFGEILDALDNVPGVTTVGTGNVKEVEDDSSRRDVMR